MHAALRPYVTTGVALAGASVIAVTPIAPAPPPDTRVGSPAVELTQSVDPFGFYTEVTQRAVKNATILTQVYQAEPFPIIQAILAKDVTAPTDILAAVASVGYSAVSWAVAGAGAATAALAAAVILP